MRLRKPCEHDRYDPHTFSLPHGDGQSVWFPFWCPGGEFLPEDALVIEKVEVTDEGIHDRILELVEAKAAVDALMEPLQVRQHNIRVRRTDQVGEPG